MTGPEPDEGAGPPEPPAAPRLEDFGLTRADLDRKTPRDILISEELATVITVVGTVVAIWWFGWWGIAVACAGLGVLYLVRRILGVVLGGGIDGARIAYLAAMDDHDKALNAHDAAMDAWEARQNRDKE